MFGLKLKFGFRQGLLEGFFRVALRFLEGLFVVEVVFFHVPMGSLIDR